MLDKQWICNIARAAYGEKFTKWLHQGKSNRYEKVTDKKVGYIGMTSRVYEAFKKSNAVSGKLQIRRIPNSFKNFSCCSLKGQII